MMQKIKKVLPVLLLVLMLMGASGCATTASFGLGYWVPISPHGRAGIDFGIGF